LLGTSEVQSHTSPVGPKPPGTAPPGKPGAASGQTDEIQSEQTGEIQLVTFKLGSGEYGIDIMQVQEIIRMPEIVRVPKAPEFVEGVINLREQVLPVIDLAKRFGTAAVSGIAAPHEASGTSGVSGADVVSGAPGSSVASGTPATSGTSGTSVAGKRTDSSRIVVTNVENCPAVGLIVDAVCEVIRIPTDTIEPLPDIVADARSDFLRGIGRVDGRLIILVDLGKMLSEEETAQLEARLEGDPAASSGAVG